MMIPSRSDDQYDGAATNRGRGWNDTVPMVAALAIALGAILGCSSSPSSSPESWTSSSFRNPDYVWAAILETLIELDYEVAESNREDGSLRTAPLADDDGSGVVLTINQVMYTLDQVNVYIKPSAGEAGSTVDPGVLKAAADLFKTTLDNKLQG